MIDVFASTTSREQWQAAIAEASRPTLGEHLQRARIAARMSSAEAAAKAGVSKKHLDALEAGKFGRGVHYRTLLALATTYGLTVSELTGEVPPPKHRLNVRAARAVSALLAALREGTEAAA